MRKAFSITFLMLVTLSFEGCRGMTAYPNFIFVGISQGMIPIVASYYIDPTLCGYNFYYSRINNNDTKDWGENLFIGEALCAGTEKMLKTVFKDARKLSSKADVRTDEVLVVPTLVSIEMFTQSLTFNKDQAIVKMKWEVTDAKKNLLWSDTITGESKRFCSASLFPFLFRCIRTNMEQALVDQFQKAINNMIKYEWWKSVQQGRSER